MEVGSTFGRTLDDLTIRGSQVQSNLQLGQEDFLKLMVAQLQNQDPLNPQDGTDFFTQIAQFDTLSTMHEIASSIKALATFSELANASSLVGRMVTAVIPAGTASGGGPSFQPEEITGTVERVTFDRGVPFVHVDGRVLRPSFITEVA